MEARGMKLSSGEFDRLALEQLDTLYRVARRLTRDPAAAEDLVQETYLRALRGRDGFDLQSFGIRPWLLRVLHNLHFSRTGRERRQPAAIDDERLDGVARPTDGAVAWANGRLDASSYEAMDERLVAALNDLPEEYGTVMLLWAVEDFSYKEIAESLDIPIGTVMSRLHRARQRMNAQLQGLAADEGYLRPPPVQDDSNSREIAGGE
jgi:RNA polymerase sigma-70 factor (ECF subfamily)